MEQNRIYRAHWTCLIRKIIDNAGFIIAILLYFRGKISDTNLNLLIAVGIVLCLLLSTISWRRKYFYTQDDDFLFSEGVFFKNNKRIPLKKITSVDIKAGVWNRILQTRILSLNTGNVTADDDEFSMTISKKDAVSIKNFIGKCNQVSECEDEIDSEVKNELKNYNENEMTLSFKEILIYTLTQEKTSVLGILFIGMILKLKTKTIKDIFYYIMDLFSNNINVEHTYYFIVQVILIIIIINISLTLLLLIINLFRYSNFTLSKSENNINIKYGKINVVEYSISMDKIQGIKFKQNWIQQILNYYKAEIIVMGADTEKSLLFPILNEGKKKILMDDLLSEYITDIQITKSPKRAIGKFVIKRSVFCAIILLCIYKLIDRFINIPESLNLIIYLVISVLLIIQAILGYIDYLNNGLGIDEHSLLIVNGSSKKNTYIIPRSKIQSSQIRQSIIQKCLNLYTYKIDIATNNFGEKIKIKNIEMEKQSIL